MPRTELRKGAGAESADACVHGQTFVMRDDLAEPNTLIVAMQSAMAQHIRSVMYTLQLVMPAFLFLVTLEWKVIARFAF